MKIDLQTHDSGLKTSLPFYLDLSSIVKIISLKQFIDLIDELKKELHDFDKEHNFFQRVKHNLRFGIYLRGQNKIYDKLVPSAGRSDKDYTPDQERNVLHRFRRRSYAHYKRILTDWETVFLARHHLLPCRLMDWSSNPLVALYWACQGEPECDGAVWILVRQPDEEYDLNVFDTPLCKYKYAGDFKFLVNGVKVIYPFCVSPRITAQGGLFTYQDEPKMPLEDYPVAQYNREHFDLFHVRKWKVPAKDKPEITESLKDFGITMQTLFPDLEGLGRGIPEIEKLRVQESVEQPDQSKK